MGKEGKCNMSDKFVSILGGRYITNGHIVKNAGPMANQNPIAQVVVGGIVGYHLKYNKKRTFYSVELVRSMYENESSQKIEKEVIFTLGWKSITAIVILIFILASTSCNVNITSVVETGEEQDTHLIRG